MSIYVGINDLVNEGRLHFLTPALSGYNKRLMYVSTDIYQLLADSASRQGNAARAIFDRYLIGGRLTVSNDKDSDVNLKQLIPTADEVWEWRIKTEPPAIRIFGSFILQDKFVALTWKVRTELGEIDSKEWELALRSYKYEWQRLFHANLPMNGDNLSDYITNILPL